MAKAEIGKARKRKRGTVKAEAQTKRRRAVEPRPGKGVAIGAGRAVVPVGGSPMLPNRWAKIVGWNTKRE
jgi:hypothetical protein